MYHLDEAEIISLYDAGWSMQSLAKRYGVAHSVIKRRLILGGVQLRTISDAVKGMYAVDPSMHERTGRQRQYELNVSLLDAISPDMAYIVGLYQADGYVSDARVSITVKPSDRALLDQVALRLSPGRPLINTSSPLGDGVALDISSTELARSFRRWGVSSPKTHSASTHPDLLTNRDYWRGVVDGDGSLCTSGTGDQILSLIGSQAICNEFLSFCRANGYSGKVNVNRHKSIYSVQIKNAAARLIATVLYDAAALYLPRKMSIYQGWRDAWGLI